VGDGFWFWRVIGCGFVGLGVWRATRCMIVRSFVLLSWCFVSLLCALCVLQGRPKKINQHCGWQSEPGESNRTNDAVRVIGVSALFLACIVGFFLYKCVVGWVAFLVWCVLVLCVGA
jgi:hypothetical protein